MIQYDTIWYVVMRYVVLCCDTISYVLLGIVLHYISVLEHDAYAHGQCKQTLLNTSCERAEIERFLDGTKVATHIATFAGMASVSDFAPACRQTSAAPSLD